MSQKNVAGQNLIGQNVTQTKGHRTKYHGTKYHRTKLVHYESIKKFTYLFKSFPSGLLDLAYACLCINGYAMISGERPGGHG